MIKLRRTPKGGIFLVLFAAMLVLSQAGTLFLYVQSAKIRTQDQNTTLVATAKAVASSINQNEFKSLTDQSAVESKTYRDQQEALDKVRYAFPNINRVTTFRIQNNDLVAVNSSGDQSTASKFLEPIDEDYTELRAILTKGASAAASDPIQDRWGTYRSGQAPILDGKGNVIGAVKVDQSEEPMDIWLAGLNNLRVTIAFSIACSAALAWLLTNYLRRDPEIQAIDRRRRDRKLFAEIVLVLLVSLLLIDGGSGVFARHKITAEQSYVTSRLNAISKLGRWIHDPKTVEIESIQTELSKFGLAPLADSLKKYVDNSSSEEAFAHAIFMESQASLKRIAHLDQEAQANNSNQARNILIATLVCAVALVIVRYATSKDEQVIGYQATSLKIQRQYQDVVENLPVGLFTFKDGNYQFANREWCAQFNPEYDEDITDAWLEAVHPEDRESVNSVIQSAEKEQHPFSIQYRVVSSNGPFFTLNHEAFPSLGQMEHLITS